MSDSAAPPEAAAAGSSSPATVTTDASQSRSAGWTTNVLPLVASGLSLLIAALSAVFAYNASQDSYVSDRRTELIAVVSQLNQKVNDGELEEGAEFLIAQAVWLAGTVPDVPAAIYRQIASAIVYETPTYEEDALPLLDEALKRAAADNDEYEQVAALRVRASIFEAEADLDGMRRDYAEAVRLSAEYDGPNIQRQHTVPAFTHVFWGTAEVRAGECEAAAEHLALAREHAAIITGSNLDEWIASLDAAVQAC